MEPEQRPDTRHRHGETGHDHPQGNIPHTHAPEKHRGLMWSGAPVAIVGALLLIWQSGNHGACSNPIVGAVATPDCGAVNTLWTIGLLLAIAGAVLFLAGVIKSALERNRP